MVWLTVTLDWTDKLPRVSVIIPTYNRAALLPRSAHSVLNQNYRDLELIIVNDGSKDNTQEVMRDLADADPRVRIVNHHMNRGQTAAFNTGIRLARGEYIAFNDDDDEWLPSKLAGQVKLMDESPPHVGAIYCWQDLMEDNSGEIFDLPHPTLEGNIHRQCLALGHPGSQIVLLIRSEAARETMFDESLRYGNDSDFNTRLSARYHYRMLPQVGVRVHGRHGHPRLTDDIEDLIAFYRSHIKTYRDNLLEYPSDLAAMYASLVYMYSLTGDPRGMCWAFILSLRYDFWTQLRLYFGRKLGQRTLKVLRLLWMSLRRKAMHHG